MISEMIKNTLTQLKFFFKKYARKKSKISGLSFIFVYCTDLTFKEVPRTMKTFAVKIKHSVGRGESRFEFLCRNPAAYIEYCYLFSFESNIQNLALILKLGSSLILVDGESCPVLLACSSPIDGFKEAVLQMRRDIISSEQLNEEDFLVFRQVLVKISRSQNEETALMKVALPSTEYWIVGHMSTVSDICYEMDIMLHTNVHKGVDVYATEEVQQVIHRPGAETSKTVSQGCEKSTPHDNEEKHIFSDTKERIPLSERQQSEKHKMEIERKDETAEIGLRELNTAQVFNVKYIY